MKIRLTYQLCEGKGLFELTAIGKIRQIIAIKVQGIIVAAMSG